MIGPDDHTFVAISVLFRINLLGLLEETFKKNYEFFICIHVFCQRMCISLTAFLEQIKEMLNDVSNSKESERQTECSRVKDRKIF